MLPHERKESGDWCANYQLFVKAAPSLKDTMLERKLNQKRRCMADDLPTTLNTERYLKGSRSDYQKDFHYRQNYRVDHLWHNKAHIM